MTLGDFEEAKSDFNKVMLINNSVIFLIIKFLLFIFESRPMLLDD